MPIIISAHGQRYEGTVSKLMFDIEGSMQIDILFTERQQQFNSPGVKGIGEAVRGMGVSMNDAADAMAVMGKAMAGAFDGHTHDTAEGPSGLGPAIDLAVLSVGDLNKMTKVQLKERCGDQGLRLDFDNLLKIDLIRAILEDQP